MASIIGTSGATQAARAYRRLKADHPSDYDFREPQLNTLGYALLREGRLADAIAIFELNVQAYPDAFNPYDSLGEALLAQGDTAAAIRNYQKSVELNPENANGVRVLTALRASRP